MTEFSRMSTQDALALCSSQTVKILDIRDRDSFEQAHLPQALHVEDIDVQNFIAEADKSVPLLIYCYHGNSSQSAAAYFAQEGFDKAISMDGGFQHWQAEGLATEA